MSENEVFSATDGLSPVRQDSQKFSMLSESDTQYAMELAAMKNAIGHLGTVEAIKVSSILVNQLVVKLKSDPQHADLAQAFSILEELGGLAASS